MKSGKERKAGGMSAIGGDEAIFQVGDGGRHGLRLEPRSHRGGRLSYFCNGAVMASAQEGFPMPAVEEQTPLAAGDRDACAPDAR